jgi:hypothetical protein
MLGVTIGIGEKWPFASENAARQVRKMTGLHIAIITQSIYTMDHPGWLKLKIPELFPNYDSFFYFDSDILLMREWKVEAMFEAMGRPFMAVPDVRDGPVPAECERFNLPHPDWYVWPDPTEWTL